MKRTMMMLVLLVMPAVMLAQGIAEEPPQRQERQAPQMTEAGQRLYDDVKRAYEKYYAIILQKAKDNEAYKSEDVWADAVKETVNADYRDHSELQRAISAMQANDRVFRREVNALVNRLAREHAEAVRELGED
jgi:hypothetical protein